MQKKINPHLGIEVQNHKKKGSVLDGLAKFGNCTEQQSAHECGCNFNSYKGSSMT